MIEFRVAGVRAGYHTGESLNTWEDVGLWSGGPRFTCWPSEAMEDICPPICPFLCLSKEKIEINHLIFLTKDKCHGFFLIV